MGRTIAKTKQKTATAPAAAVVAVVAVAVETLGIVTPFMLLRVDEASAAAAAETKMVRTSNAGMTIHMANKMMM